MRFNQDSLKFLSQQNGEKEGRIMYKAPKEGYRNRWIKLKSNLLFIFKLNDQGTLEGSDPAVVLVLERITVQMELPDQNPFVFSIDFDGERKHYFSGQTERHCLDWVEVLKSLNYSSLKAEFEFLRSQVKSKTGEDPVKIPSKKTDKFKNLSRYSTPFTATQPFQDARKELQETRHTVGVSAFYTHSATATKFKDWETFD